MVEDDDDEVVVVVVVTGTDEEGVRQRGAVAIGSIFGPGDGVCYQITKKKEAKCDNWKKEIESVVSTVVRKTNNFLHERYRHHQR